MNITEQEVRRVAELANLALTEEEFARMVRHLSGILNMWTSSTNWTLPMSSRCLRSL